MSSLHAQRIQAARGMLWKQHAELVPLRALNDDGVLVERQILGVWKRVTPDDDKDTDGIGAQGYRGTARFTVKLADLPTLPSNEAVLIRNGETWEIRHGEPQDEWTWVLHLARPNADLRMPARLK